ncbi:DUF334 domain-containing protein [Kordia jejudonensis]|uniref:hypothetical protein n=1 Tax=Kordia jejudonensis TaxID=1348245 RepID=UPI0006292624|nr:hypothetical protein [Kordia jejudonensis]
MSSYNDNLHSSVVTSLNTQELELQKVKSKQDASMFSLYYAQGARITASEKLEVTTEKYDYQQKVNGQATVDSDISTNVLASAKNTKTYADKSVTNTSVAAANVQIATNAIVKLSSDTGSILSIVSAGDYGTEIYEQAKNAAILMDNTAYVAEVASQKSMEASASISEVSTKTLLDKATITDTSIKDLLKVVSGQLEATNDLVQTETNEVSTTGIAEKKAEGQLEDIRISYRATQNAYRLSNAQLNLNLTVLPALDHQKFTATFDIYENPFFSNITIDGNTENTPPNPVENYYVMLVKESKKQTFSINIAENIITNNEKSYIEISPSDAVNGKISSLIYTADPNNDSDDITIKVLHDSDGNKLKLGDEYVIFVLTVFTTVYKKSINTFDDYLSAPSAMFSMAHNLLAPNYQDITVIPADSAPQTLGFPILQKTSFSFDFNSPKITSITPEYRCIFLPDNSELIDGLMTAKDLFRQQLIIENEELIAAYKHEIKDLEKRIEFLKGKKANADSSAKDTKSVNVSAIETQIEESQSRITTLEGYLTSIQSNLSGEESEKIKPGFFFNKTIAAQIPAGSYTKGTVESLDPIAYFSKKYPTEMKDLQDNELKKLQDSIKKLTKDFLKGKSIIKLYSDFLKVLKDSIKVERKVNSLIKSDAFQQEFNKMILGYEAFYVSMELKPETTDNFGNRLIANNLYIPAVLVVSDASETTQAMFTNALSLFSSTANFTYHTENQKNSYQAVNELVANQDQKSKK